uniref:Uncharacterized protein n=1 Tax=Candidatus Methanogaster sp. ANME-2c ERB4 TaxID=2759911 RepID=A0A7G9YG12_9EURY|nr:hypothetical protein CLAIAILK_00007 [Methanosarcinales archaeon ANME-2c ERB4]
MDLMKDLTEIITDQFKECGISYTDSNDVHKLLREYINTCSKMISPIPRKVFISEELKSKEPEEISSIFDEIKTKFEKGYNVNPHLSKRLLDLKSDDYLYHSWGIYHLHLTNTKKNKSDFFYDRPVPDSLLFFIVRGNDVYFIDILPHNEENIFSKRRMLEIIKNNWHDLLEPCKVQGMEGAGYNDKEIGQLRKDGTNSPIEIDGSTYLPIGGGGLSVSRTNLMHHRYVNDFIEKTIEIERQIREELSKTVQDVPDNPDFHLCLEESGLVIKETNTDACITSLNNFYGFCYLTMMLNQNSGFSKCSKTRRVGNVA